MSGSSEKRVAAVDCGTNSTRLLVAQAGPNGELITIDRRMQITRLGQGVDHTGNLDPVAIERTIAVLRDYRSVAERAGVSMQPDAVRITATSAARDASNRDVLFGAVRAAVGVEPELLSGSDEGRLSFLGATADLSPDLGPFLVVDIGGGSTEFVTGSIGADGQPVVTGARSVDLGCVRVTEQFLHSDPPLGAELAEATTIAGRIVDEALAALPDAHQARTVVGLAGTVSAVAAIDAGMGTYDRNAVHHRWIDASFADGLLRRLAAVPTYDRREVVGLEPERADVIVGGLVVLQAVLGRTAGRLLTSEADILDGLASSLLP
ncbi:MAG: Ppx/GppA phosphatase family protein [Acidimicrobiales bacterium]